MSSVLDRYYLLCSAHSGSRRHVVNDIPEGPTIALSRKEIDLYLRIQDGVYVAREFVIGAASPVEPIILIL